MLKLIYVNIRITVHNEELHNLYFSKTIIQNYKIKLDEMVGAYDTHGKDKKYDALVRKPEVQNRTESSTDDVKTLKCNSIRSAGLNWSFGSGQDPVAGSCEYRN